MRDIVEKTEILAREDNVVVGINGLDCSGKTTFALKLLEELASRGHQANLLHVDDYNNLMVQEQVYQAHAAGGLTPEIFDLYYHQSIDYDRLAQAISTAKAAGKILLVEGVFLFRPPVLSLIDYKVFMEVTHQVGRSRYAARKVVVGDDRPLTVFDDIWLPAFERYCVEFNPRSGADQIFTDAE